MSTSLISYLLTGPLMLLISILFYAFPPKAINHVYGYRTKRSMKNQQTWDEANRYANKLMLWFFIAITVIEGLIFLFVSYQTGLTIASAMIVLALILVVMLTERHLKKSF
ncbi:SdpI family protein [Fulvivirga ligni]|uniref:SdpI family protein n=1 Tax=Fulvivirga ligni TaxID=2904246 RepID=UPI001F15C717|nr:SdpI family protein [Fulvivirga ligni]UII22481.1 SdpI family protein [Fulvivirga ligni]